MAPRALTKLFETAQFSDIPDTITRNDYYKVESMVLEVVSEGSDRSPHRLVTDYTQHSLFRQYDSPIPGKFICRFEFFDGQRGESLKLKQNTSYRFRNVRIKVGNDGVLEASIGGDSPHQQEEVASDNAEFIALTTRKAQSMAMPRSNISLPEGNYRQYRPASTSALQVQPPSDLITQQPPYNQTPTISIADARNRSVGATFRISVQICRISPNNIDRMIMEICSVCASRYVCGSCPSCVESHSSFMEYAPMSFLLIDGAGEQLVATLNSDDAIAFFLPLQPQNFALDLAKSLDELSTRLAPVVGNFFNCLDEVDRTLGPFVSFLLQKLNKDSYRILLSNLKLNS